MAPVRFAHLTDFHLPIPGRPPLRALMNKRLLGYLSWRRSRRFRHRSAAADRIAADACAAECDLFLITGDLVNLALPAEFEAAAAWLGARFDPARSAFAPGNHDAYVPVSWEGGLGLWDAYMTGARGEEAARPPSGPDDFPYVKAVGDVVFVIANTARPTAPALATGRLGHPQRDRLRRELGSARGRFRVLALHHPVTEGIVSRRKALDDAAEIRSVLAETGAELVLHGHAHRPSWDAVKTPCGEAPVAGGGSASHGAAHGSYRAARYNLFEVDRAADGWGWRLDVCVRELDPANGEVRTVERRTLIPAA